MFEGPPKTKKDKETVGRREGRRNPLLSLWSTGSKQLRKWVDVRRGLREQMISHLHTKPIRNILRSSWPSLSSLAVFCLTDQQQNQPSGSGHLPELVASLCAVSRGVLYCCDSEAMCRQLHLILPLCPIPTSPTIPSGAQQRCFSVGFLLCSPARMLLGWSRLSTFPSRGLFKHVADLISLLKYELLFGLFFKDCSNSVRTMIVHGWPASNTHICGFLCTGEGGVGGGVAVSKHMLGL